jgi:mono/diheme cytochrome c family protein
MNRRLLVWVIGRVLLGLVGAVMLPLASVIPAAAQQANASPNETTIDVPRLFATTCGWCHSDGGRAPGKGPQLMGTQRSDDFIRNRIKTGKQGAMPAFDQILSNADIDEIVKYIRSLKPDQG